MVEKGFVTAKMGEPTPERGGRRKRFYMLTGKEFRGVHKSCRFSHGLHDLCTPSGTIDFQFRRQSLRILLWSEGISALYPDDLGPREEAYPFHSGTFICGRLGGEAFALGFLGFLG